MAEGKVIELEKKLADMHDAMAKMKLVTEMQATELAAAKAKSEAKTVFISKDRKLQKFSGKQGQSQSELLVEEWIEDASYHIRNITPVGVQVEFLLDHLVGQARDEFRVVPERDRDSPEKIFRLLGSLFQDADTVAQIQTTFYQRSQKQGETLQEYSLVLMKIMDRLCKKQRSAAGNKDLMLRERFVDGILDVQLKREMRRFALERSETSFADFRAIVLKWCEDDKKGTQSVGSSVQEVQVSQVDTELTAVLKSQQELLSKQQEQIDKLSKLVEQGVSESSRVSFGRGRGRGYSSRGSYRGSRRGCYRCGKFDHLIKDCPQPAENDKVEKNLNL
jgi:hypothetical protein